MEQRREPRVPVQYPVSFEGEDGVGKGQLVDLSCGGAAVEVASGPSAEIGTSIKLWIYVPVYKEPILVNEARMTWTTGEDFGVAFLGLDPQELDRLQRHVADLQQGTAPTQ